MSVGLIAALPAEARSAVGHTIDPGPPVILNKHLVAIVSGMGPERAQRAADQLIKLNVTALISWGTAAALVKPLQAGDLILPDKVTGYDGKCYIPDPVWRESILRCAQDRLLPCQTGGLAETSVILSTVEKKTLLQRQSGAICADMESAAIMATAHDVGLPAIAVRAIIDEYHEQLPQAVTHHLNTYGEPDIKQLLFSLLKNPALLPRLLRLGLAMHKASKTLTKVRQSMGETMQYYD